MKMFLDDDLKRKKKDIVEASACSWNSVILKISLHMSCSLNI